MLVPVGEDELVGKTIEEVISLGDGYGFVFTDGTFTSVVHEYNYGDGYVSIEKPDLAKAIWYGNSAVEAGICTQEEADRFHERQRGMRELEQEQQDWKRYQELKKKFEGK